MGMSIHMAQCRAWLRGGVANWDQSSGTKGYLLGSEEENADNLNNNYV